MTRRRLASALLVVLALSLCGLVAGMTSLDPSAPAPSVSFELDFPVRAIVREATRLTLTIENSGPTTIDDVGLKINRGYSNVMTIIETRPLSRIDDAPNERRLYFGRLAVGEKAAYVIIVAPRSIGSFTLTARVVGARRGLDPQPLMDRTSGQSEVQGTTTVVAAR